MDSLALVILLVVVLIGLVNAVALKVERARFEPVRSRRVGPLGLELRRRVLVTGHDNGRGGLAFMQVHELRMRLLRVCGVPLWRRVHAVELPTQVAGMQASLTARDFDAEFPDAFQEREFARRNDDAHSTLLHAGASRH